jgi:hypothetical protein
LAVTSLLQINKIAFKDFKNPLKNSFYFACETFEFILTI